MTSSNLTETQQNAATDARDVPHDLRLKRLRYRASYRGTKELDLVFRSFMDAHLISLKYEELNTLEKLMECKESDLMAWLFGMSPVPAEFDTNVFHKLKNFTPSK